MKDLQPKIPSIFDCLMMMQQLLDDDAAIA
jgi:hypothetical protein